MYLHIKTLSYERENIIQLLGIYLHINIWKNPKNGEKTREYKQEVR